MKTREVWLKAAAKKIEALFKRNGYEIPNYVVGCGLPPKGAFAAKNRTLGICINKKISTGKRNEIFISPVVDNAMEVISILSHEMVHAVVGCDKGHGKEFKRCATAIGLTGKMTSTEMGPELTKWAIELVKKMPAYPHKKLVYVDHKKQGTRMLKVECDHCGYVVRTTKSWLEKGLPKCPDGIEMRVA